MLWPTGPVITELSHPLGSTFLCLKIELHASWAGQPLREAGCCSQADPVLGVGATVACLLVYLPIAVAVAVTVADSATLTGRLHTQVGRGCRPGGFVRGRGCRVVLRIDVGLR
jgi:hypothetical protein